MAAPARIFVPQPIPPDAAGRLAALGEVTTFPHTDRRITREEVLAAVSDAEVLFALGGIPYDRQVIESTPGLRLIAAMHPWPTFVDLDAATERGVVVTGIPNLIARTTAEATFAILMATAWRIPEADRYLRAGRWHQNQSMDFLTTRMYDKTVGIVGMGEIGTLVAGMAIGCGMRVIYTKRTRLDANTESALGVEHRGLEALFEESDFVVLTVALTEDTRGLVGRRLLSVMKPTAMLINTSRGQVVDEAALEEALRGGIIAGAGLDVFEHEAPHPDPGPRPGILDLPNVVVTPHYGSAARETRSEMANRTVDNIEAFLAGRRPPDVINAEIYGGTRIPDDRIG